MSRILACFRLLGLDRLAIGISGLCVVHCVATSVLLVVMSAGAGLLIDPLFHEVGLCLAIAIGGIAMVRGFLRHRRVAPALIGTAGLCIMAAAMTLPHDSSGREALWTIVGVSILALGHHLNRRHLSRGRAAGELAATSVRA